MIIPKRVCPRCGAETIPRKAEIVQCPRCRYRYKKTNETGAIASKQTAPITTQMGAT